MEGMRVLVATVPASGHVLPLLPLARRLHQLGDDVLWATGPDQCEQLASEPFAKAAVGPPLALWFQQLASRTRAQDAVLPICAGVVSHGGSGTTLGALAHGLPHVLV